MTWLVIECKFVGKVLEAIENFSVNHAMHKTTLGYVWCTFLTNPFHSCINWQLLVQTLTQFFHCNFKRRMLLFTKSDISSALVVVFKSLPKTLVYKFWIFLNRMYARKWAFQGLPVDSSICWTHSKNNNWSSSVSKCSRSRKCFTSEEHFSTLREIVSCDNGILLTLSAASVPTTVSTITSTVGATTDSASVCAFLLKAIDQLWGLQVSLSPVTWGSWQVYLVWLEKELLLESSIAVNAQKPMVILKSRSNKTILDLIFLIFSLDNFVRCYFLFRCTNFVKIFLQF